MSPTGTILLWRCEGPVGAGLLRILHDRLDQRFASAKARWREYDGQLRQELPLIGLRYDKPKSGGK